MYRGETKMEVECRCPLCGEIKMVTVRKKDYIAWSEGALIQRAFPYLSANNRERLSTGICPKCWDEMFGIEGEE